MDAQRRLAVEVRDVVDVRRAECRVLLRCDSSLHHRGAVGAAEALEQGARQNRERTGRAAVVVPVRRLVAVPRLDPDLEVGRGVQGHPPSVDPVVDREVLVETRVPADGEHHLGEVCLPEPGERQFEGAKDIGDRRVLDPADALECFNM